jgi:anti-anti-sigma regulatory factor
MDIAALRCFLAARERSRSSGRGFILVGANPFARRLFELTGAGYLLDEQEAVSMLDQFTGRRVSRSVRYTAPSRVAHV